jgi:hypothetical protein
MTQRTRWLTIALLLFVFGFWLNGFAWLHLRPDEHLVYMHTETATVFGTIHYQATQDVQAPLWHSFFWTWRQLMGDTEFAGRYQGVLWSMLTASLFFRLGRRYFGGAWAGALMVIAVAANSYFFTYAFEIRPYPTVLLSAVWSMWCVLRWFESPTRRRAIFYGLSLAIMAYTHYFMAFLALVQLIYIAWRRPAAWRTLSWSVGLAAGLWLPWSPVFIGQVQALAHIDGAFGIASTTTATSFGAIVRLNRLATNGVWPVVWGTVALGLFTYRRRYYGLLVLWALGVPVLAFTTNLFASVYDPRYIVYMSLGIGAAVGVALAALRPRWVGAVLIAAYVGLMLFNLQEHLPNRIPYRTIFETVSANSRPGDALYYDVALQDTTFVYWQLLEYMAPHLVQNGMLTLEQAETHRRVWHMTSNIRDESVRDNFTTLERTRPLTAVAGGCDPSWCYVAQLLEGAPLHDPVHFITSRDHNADVLPFYGGEAVLTDAGVQVKLWWMPDTALAQDYSISVRLVDKAGQIVIQTDGPPTDQGGTIVNTSQMEPQRMLLDVRSFSAPASPGTYTVQIVVYHPLDSYTLTTAERDSYSVTTVIIP